MEKTLQYLRRSNYLFYLLHNWKGLSVFSTVISKSRNIQISWMFGWHFSVILLPKCNFSRDQDLFYISYLFLNAIYVTNFTTYYTYSVFRLRTSIFLQAIFFNQGNIYNFLTISATLKRLVKYINRTFAYNYKFFFHRLYLGLIILEI